MTMNGTMNGTMNVNMDVNMVALFNITFLSRIRLWLLLLVGALLIGYIVAQTLRRRYTVRLASAELFDAVVPKRPGWWRHIPPVLFIAAMAASVVAFARPVRIENVSRNQATVIVAIDISLSMMSDDVTPTRLDAAKAAATQFVTDLPDNLNVGLVSFSGTATVRVSPTTDHAEVIRAIDSLELAPATAIGEAIYASLGAVASLPVDNPDQPTPAVIVLLSDGETTEGRPDEDAAEAAAAAGVPVSTISVGTPYGTITYDDPDTPEYDPLTTDVPVADDNLVAIADATGGSAFTADSLDRLEEVYADIGEAYAAEPELTDIADRFAGAAFALMAVAGALSLIWFRRLT